MSRLRMRSPINASVSAARAVVVAQWRDAGRAERIQASVFAGVIVLVFAVFAAGASTRQGADGPATPGTLSAAAPGAPERRSATRPTSTQRRLLSALRDSALRPAGAAKKSAIRPLGPRRRGAAAPRKRQQPKKRPGSPGTPSPTPGAGAPTAPEALVVGVAYRAASSAAALADRLGVRDRPGDVARQAAAVRDWINAHGGVKGRPLSLRLATFDPALRVSLARAFSDACDALGAGAGRPVAVVGAVVDAAAQTGCLGARDIPLVGDGPAPGDSRAFANAGRYLFSPGSMALDRLATGYARALGRQGFVDRRSRVGVLRIDAPAFERADLEALRPALAPTGARIVSQALLPPARSALDVPGLLAGVSAAVLRFRLARVDRVVVLDDGAVAGMFMSEAELLGYRPRYGLNSTMVPAALVRSVPARQLRGAVGAGFAPLLDVTADGEPAPSATRRQCEEIYRAAGVAVGDRGADGAFAAVALCDGLLAVRAALEKAADTSSGALAGALEGLGTSRPSAVALSSRLDAQHHHGAAELRPLAFDEGCRCVRYTGAGEPTP